MAELLLLFKEKKYSLGQETADYSAINRFYSAVNSKIKVLMVFSPLYARKQKNNEEDKKEKHMSEKITISTGNVQETLLLPLWGRAMETGKEKPRMIDNKAVEIMDRLDYDFSVITKNLNPVSQLGWVVRSLRIDQVVSQFIKEHPRATIINIGCGLDTVFERVDNGEILFYELDLPDVIELRKIFFEENPRRKMIARSFLERDWYEQIEVHDGLFCIAGGVFCYFEEAQIRDFFIAMADHFGSCDFYFDTLSPLGLKIARKKILKSGGMDAKMPANPWGVKQPKTMEQWDPRIKVISAHPFYQGMKKGVSFSEWLGLNIADLLGMASLAHIRMV